MIYLFEKKENVVLMKTLSLVDRTIFFFCRFLRIFKKKKNDNNKTEEKNCSDSLEILVTET